RVPGLPVLIYKLGAAILFPSIFFMASRKRTALPVADRVHAGWRHPKTGQVFFCCQSAAVA
ncbi:MAG: hypothetical protein MN733_42530, partial [Nitrososphaera sp.]|nr:hypothetical protein [Nitrososphaera sp.]